VRRPAVIEVGRVSDRPVCLEPFYHPVENIRGRCAPDVVLAMPGAAGIHVIVDLEGLVFRADDIVQAFGTLHIHQPVIGAVGDERRAFYARSRVAHVEVHEDFADFFIDFVSLEVLQVAVQAPGEEIFGDITQLQ
jgi:hypothetical protein